MEKNRHSLNNLQAWKKILGTAVLISISISISISAWAQIYRCTDGETTVFSDKPCSDSAEIHDSESRISVVEAAKDLEDISQRNEEFVEQRRQRLERRSAEREVERTRPRHPQRYADSRHRFGHFDFLPFHRRFPDPRGNDGGDGARPPMRGPVSEDSFTLSGRQLGSRTDSDQQ